MFKFLAKSALSYTIFKKYGKFIFTLIVVLLVTIFIFILSSDLNSYLNNFYSYAITNNISSDINSYHTYLTLVILSKWVITFFMFIYIINLSKKTFFIEKKVPQETLHVEDVPKIEYNDIDEIMLKKDKLRTKGETILDIAQKRKNSKEENV